MSKLIIPEGTKEITQAMLSRYDRRQITEVVIPQGVITIRKKAFCGCYSLTSVTIPDSVTEIRSDVFVGCRSLDVATKERIRALEPFNVIN